MWRSSPHTSESYLSRLILKGYKVAICEQLESPKNRQSSKGPLNRDVVRVITPGTFPEETLLEAKLNNFLLSLCDEPTGRPPSQTASIGIAFVDISTGDF